MVPTERSGKLEVVQSGDGGFFKASNGCISAVKNQDSPNYLHIQCLFAVLSLVIFDYGSNALATVVWVLFVCPYFYLSEGGLGSVRLPSGLFALNWKKLFFRKKFFLRDVKMAMISIAWL